MRVCADEIVWHWYLHARAHAHAFNKITLAIAHFYSFQNNLLRPVVIVKLKYRSFLARSLFLLTNAFFMLNKIFM